MRKFGDMPNHNFMGSRWAEKDTRSSMMKNQQTQLEQHKVFHIFTYQQGDRFHYFSE